VAHAKHEEVRARYRRCCGYCGVSEADAGGELTVDHFRPTSAGGDDSDDNLVYACIRCNLNKSDFFPSPDDLARGRRLLQPLQDEVAVHIRHNEQTGQLEPLTVTGRFHIELLDLNRPPLVAHRLQRRLAMLRVARIQMLELEVTQLRAILASQDDYIAHLQRLLGLPSEEDD